MIQYIDGELRIIDEKHYFYATCDNRLPELQYAITLAIEALTDDGCHHNPEAASILLDLLRLTLPSLRQARLYSYIPEDEPIDALPA